MRGTGQKPPLPDVKGGKLFLDAISDLGICKNSGMTLEALSFCEIEAYSRSCGGLLAREVMTIRKMSQAYVSEIKKSENPFSIPPMERR